MTEPHNEFTALPLAQRALLWCMRMWVLQLRRGAETQARVGDMLGQLGAPSAAPHFESLMLALVHGTTRELEVLCVCRTEVAADERALLEVLSLAQAGRSLDALLALRSILPAQDAGAALHSAEEVGAILAQAGRFLPAPDESLRRFARAPGPLPTRLARHVLH